jgi:hypothetical protein
MPGTEVCGMLGTRAYPPIRARATQPRRWRSVARSRMRCWQRLAAGPDADRCFSLPCSTARPCTRSSRLAAHPASPRARSTAQRLRSGSPCASSGRAAWASCWTRSGRPAGSSPAIRVPRTCKFRTSTKAHGLRQLDSLPDQQQRLRQATLPPERAGAGFGNVTAAFMSQARAACPAASASQRALGLAVPLSSAAATCGRRPRQPPRR